VIPTSFEATPSHPPQQINQHIPNNASKESIHRRPKEGCRQHQQPILPWYVITSTLVAMRVAWTRHHLHRVRQSLMYIFNRHDQGGHHQRQYIPIRRISSSPRDCDTLEATTSHLHPRLILSLELIADESLYTAQGAQWFQVRTNHHLAVAVVSYFRATSAAADSTR
jgi:hypothetical protein